MSWTREELITHYNDIIDEEVLRKINKKYNLYIQNNYPLDYILWYVEYGELRFDVNESVLIPRPETEYMIEAVREYLDELVINNDQLTIDKNSQFLISNFQLILVDVGTGSGVLGLSVLHTHGEQIDQALLIDMSDDALRVARGNYAKLLKEEKINKDLRVDIIKGNLLEPVTSTPSLLLPEEGDHKTIGHWDKGSEKILKNLKSFDSTSLRSRWCNIIITANLPYIPDEDFDTNPDKTIKYEPRVAFVGGDDGLDLYREMFSQIIHYQWSILNWPSIESNYHSMTMFLEMMTWQVDILREEFEWLEFEEIKTFHANIRIVKTTYKLEAIN